MNHALALRTTANVSAPRSIVSNDDTSGLTRRERRALESYNAGTEVETPLAERFSRTTQRPAPIRHHAG